MRRDLAKRLTQPSSLGVLTALVLIPALWLGCSSSGTRPEGTGGSVNGTGGAGGGAGGEGAGTGGAPNVCNVPSNSVSSCDSPTKPTLELLSDFSSGSWQSGAGKWGVCGNLLGAIQSYKGAKTSSGGVTTGISHAVDTTAGKFTLTGSVAESDYAGGIMAFATCADLTDYTGLQFTLGGTTAGCSLILQLQTLSQQSSEYGGKCTPDSTAGISCYLFPNTALPFGTAPISVKFADLDGTGMPSAAADFKKEIIGLQWQLQAGSGDCVNFAFTIDDVKLTK